MERELKRKKTFDEQIDLLKNRNLIIDNEKQAKYILSKVNYYRLSGYFKYFYQSENRFKEGTSFDDIYNIYKFDTELRRLIMSLTEEVEISFRTYVAYYIAHNFGEEGYLDSSKFNEKYHNKFIDNIKEKINAYKEKEFIKHHNKQYNGKLPIWVIVEIFSFNDLSRLYGNMSNKDRKNIIRNNYVNIDILYSAIDVHNWIRILCDVRNICAHYERLFNRRLTNSFKLPRKYNKVFSNTLFSVLIVLKLLINNEIIWDDFLDKFYNLLDKYNFSDFEALGFTNDWKLILESKKD